MGKILKEAAANKDWEKVKLMIQCDANLSLKRSSGKTALHMAAEQGELEMVKLLVQKGAVKTSKTEKGTTPILTAVEKGNLEIALVLLGTGKLPKSQKDALGKHLLEACTTAKTGARARTLVALGANTEEKDAKGNTGLMLISASGDAEL